MLENYLDEYLENRSEDFVYSMMISIDQSYLKTKNSNSMKNIEKFYFNFPVIGSNNSVRDC